MIRMTVQRSIQYILYTLWVTSFFRSRPSSWVAADSIYNISITVPPENTWMEKKILDIESQRRSQGICTLFGSCLQGRDYGWAARALYQSSAFNHSFQCDSLREGQCYDNGPWSFILPDGRKDTMNSYIALIFNLYLNTYISCTIVATKILVKYYMN